MNRTNIYQHGLLLPPEMNAEEARKTHEERGVRMRCQ